MKTLGKFGFSDPAAGKAADCLLWVAAFVLANFLTAANFNPGDFIAADDNDFITFAMVLERGGDFDHTLVQPIARKVGDINALVWISRWAFHSGIGSGAQFIVSQLVLSVLLATGLVGVLKAYRLPPLLGVYFLLLFFFSVYSGFGRYLNLSFFGKPVASTLAISAGFIGMALLLNGMAWAALLLGCILIYFHPTHAVVLAGVTASFMVVEFWRSGHKSSFSSMSKMLFLLATTIPFWVLFVRSGALSSDALVDFDAWYRFLIAKTSNPFPLEDGLPTVLCILCAMGLGLCLNRLHRPEMEDVTGKSSPMAAADWWILCVLILWGVQIFFSSLLPKRFIIQLALTRASPYAGVLILAGLAGAYLHAFRRENLPALALLGWLLLAAAPFCSHLPMLHEGIRLFDNGWRQKWIWLPGVTRNFDPVVVLLAVVTCRMWLRYFEDQPLKHRRKWATSSIDWLLGLSGLAVLGGGLVLFGGKPLYYVLLAGLLFNAAAMTRPNTFRRRVASFHPQASFCLALAVVAAVIWTTHPRTIKSAGFLHDWLASTSDEFERLPDSIRRMIATHVRENEMILPIPLGEGDYGSLAPTRPVFIDRWDPQFVLYDPTLLDRVKRRIELIGMDLERDVFREDLCPSGWERWWRFMCYRTRYFDASRRDTGTWRRNIGPIQAEAPNLKFALVRRTYACEEDRVLAASGPFVLIPLNGVAGPECRRLTSSDRSRP